ncbi:MAG: TIGR02281 family clan AA aspartic protease [Sphingomonadales bacterium]|nr:TIGR02281 family clan AA aspartic protease [Sphingomonadales bacterium]
MMRLAAYALSAVLAMIALSLPIRGLAPGANRAQAVAAPVPATANPWSRDAPAPQRWQFVAGTGASASDAGPTVLARDATGHFHVAATVNGGSADFLVDTGADLVALSRDEAQRLGLFVQPEDFHPMLRTASGIAGGARVKIDHLAVAGSELHDVDAVVVDGLAVNLLGQSALRRLGRVEEHGDSMVITPD